MYFGYKSGNRQTDMNDHWEKEGKNDMKNCSGCACGRSAKAAQGDPKGGPYFGQLGAHSKYHKNEYYNHYGECEQDRKRPKSILERVLDNL